MKRFSVFVFYSILIVCITSFNTISQHNTDHTGIEADRHSRPASNDGFTIRGKITGIHSGIIKLTVRNIEDGKSRVIDSATINHDSFELKGKVDHPQMMYVLVKPGNWSFQLFIENSDIRVSADTTGSQYYDYTQSGGSRWAFINNMLIRGSKSQDDWMKYQKDAGQKKYDSLYAAIRKANAEEKDTAARNKREDRWDSLHEQEYKLKQDLIYAYVRRNPSSIVGIYAFYDLFQYAPTLSLSKMDSTVNLFTGEAASSAYDKILLDAINKRKAVLPGSTAPDFTLLKRDSSSFTLSSTRGKYMLIDFWASWCLPCRKAIPHWKQVYEKYHARGFDIVSVSDDNQWKLWFAAMDQEKMPWQQVVDEFPVKGQPARVGELYQTRFIPFYVLLDKEGKIILYTNDEDAIDAKLKELLG